MEPTWKLHECSRLPKESVEVIREKYRPLRNEQTWYLVIRREATEEHLLENQYLEQAGETIWETRIEIRHCPYCGEALSTQEQSDFEDFGRFEHVDYSGWNSKAM